MKKKSPIKSFSLKKERLCRSKQNKKKKYNETKSTN